MKKRSQPLHGSNPPNSDVTPSEVLDLLAQNNRGATPQRPVPIDITTGAKKKSPSDKRSSTSQGPSPDKKSSEMTGTPLPFMGDQPDSKEATASASAPLMGAETDLEAGEKRREEKSPGTITRMKQCCSVGLTLDREFFEGMAERLTFLMMLTGRTVGSSTLLGITEPTGAVINKFYSYSAIANALSCTINMPIAFHSLFKGCREKVAENDHAAKGIQTNKSIERFISGLSDGTAIIGGIATAVAINTAPIGYARPIGAVTYGVSSGLRACGAFFATRRNRLLTNYMDQRIHDESLKASSYVETQKTDKKLWESTRRHAKVDYNLAIANTIGLAFICIEFFISYYLLPRLEENSANERSSSDRAEQIHKVGKVCEVGFAAFALMGSLMIILTSLISNYCHTQQQAEQEKIERESQQMTRSLASSSSSTSTDTASRKVPAPNTVPLPTTPVSALRL